MPNLPNNILLSSASLLPLRLLIGFGFAAHGFAKLSRGVDGFADILQALSVPAPHFTAWATSLIELFGGLAIMAGAFVPFVSIPLAIIMLTALLTVHLPFGFSSIKLMAITADGPQFGKIGYELNLLYIAGLFALALAGPGPFSVDALIKRKNKISAASR
jgi:putative oxidoreductase